MTAERCRPSRALEYKIQVPSKLPRMTTLRPTYKHMLLTNCKLIFSWEPKLDYCLSRKALLNCQRVLPSDIQVCLQNIRSALKQHFKELHIQCTFYPTLICNLYMHGYLSITRRESIWVSNYDAMPQYSRSAQKSILRREIYEHTTGQKNGQQWSLGLPKFPWKNVYSRIPGSESFCIQNSFPTQSLGIA